MKFTEDYSNLKKCLRQVHSFDRDLLKITIIVSLLEAFIPYVPFLLISYLLDGLSKNQKLSELLIVSACTVVVLFLMNLVRGRLNYAIWPHTENSNDMMDGLYAEKTLNMDYQQLDSEKINDLRTRIQNDRNWGGGIYGMIPQLQGCLSGLFGLFTAIILVVPIFIRGHFYQRYESIIFLLFAIVLITLSSWFQKNTAEKELKIREGFDFGSGRSSFLLRGGITYREGKDVRIYGAKKLIKASLKEEKKDIMVQQISNLEARAGAFDGAISGLLLGGAFMFVVLQAMDGKVSAGSVVLFATSIYRFSESIKSLAKSYSEITVNAKRMQSSFSYHDIPDVLKKGKRPVPKDLSDLTIELKDVSFHYPSGNQEVLSKVSLTLRPGDQMAIVGKNGSGKSTLIKLLCRLYEPTSGTILLNGIDIGEYDYDEYLKLFSVVFQDFKLLPLSLGRNLSTNAVYDKSRAEECLRRAGFHQRFKSMKGGLETPLYHDMEEDGIELSGGEGQKVALARALYKDAPFVVLDEPTAALDPVSEYEIYTGFQNMVEGKTAVFISHRLSSCRFCKEIIVLDHGRIIQQGSHEELVEAKDSLYYELWQAQAKYYQRATEMRFLESCD